MITQDDKCLRECSKYITKNLENNEIVFFDVGLNKGDWSSLVLSMLTDKYKVQIHGFEPNPVAYSVSHELFKHDNRVVANNFGLSSKCTSTILYDPGGNGSAIGSMYKRPVYQTLGGSPELIEHSIELSTLEQYTKTNNIEHINYLKIDVEGHELDVLFGARKFFEKRAINAGQFETGGTFQDAGICMMDFVEFFKQYNYGMYFQRVHRDNEITTNISFEWENILFVNKSLNSLL
jgi:FkbM family methyltransferase